MKASRCKFSKCLYFSANALARKVEKMAQDIWKEVGLSPSHAYVLMLVLDEPGIQPGAIAREIQLKPSTVTRLIEKLEVMRLVQRTTSGKLTNVYPTPKGNALHPRLKSGLTAFHEKYTAILGKEESMRFVEQVNLQSDKLG
jgi:DNA-binding MarR family transcriptional regulator